MMKISDEAIELVQKLQKESSSADQVLTLLSAGAGCGAPAIKLEMRPPLEDDLISEYAGFSIHIRPAISQFLDNAVISADDTFWGKRLKVKTVYGCK